MKTTMKTPYSTLVLALCVHMRNEKVLRQRQAYKAQSKKCVSAVMRMPRGGHKQNMTRFAISCSYFNLSYYNTEGFVNERFSHRSEQVMSESIVKRWEFKIRMVTILRWGSVRSSVISYCDCRIDNLAWARAANAIAEN
ncbi:hypothetical protein SERLADRAFT_476212 [Serpula lacrymans var. lacrymans S7.9]|uniref:Uncharacterized protein n=1 Tax=Serpula lacrymans var. lacrymans (strain S7.9) TaxID=578457 RepID=F8P746_SERL9|nr:uncharacterized protein SERLADRAFT_476212 [Serpula lacrymans var. lacrymans S7.9]EGO21262.1 hypothetical protein SERLADRAFT_476212 [Serpula lacrymans var. lacrymans S7.9]